MNGIIDDINAQIENAIRCLFGDEMPFLGFTLAKPVQITDDTTDMSMPAIIDNNGECHYVFTDDSYAIGWYHRLLSRNYSAKPGFGDNNLDVKNDEILLVCWGLSNVLQMQAEEVESKVIVPSIPGNALLVSSNFDAKSVLSGEFRNINYLNKPEEFIFSVKYRVQTAFNRKCKNKLTS
ncbi:MAG: hypothetical protein LBP72_01120 [Dysgonamonadaceae bacterium]|jgi:hypothetical protein|nr:hypothetical protein [Dysgonamonadaceae bacterium]